LSMLSHDSLVFLMPSVSITNFTNVNYPLRCVSVGKS
jgi:hypothetical protein